MTTSGVTGTGPLRVNRLLGIFGANAEIQSEAASSFISELSRMLARFCSIPISLYAESVIPDVCLHDLETSQACFYVMRRDTSLRVFRLKP